MTKILVTPDAEAAMLGKSMAQKCLLPAVADFGAEFSPDRKYRYSLWRIWDRTKPLAMFIGLNPSTANETEPDNTIKRVGGISKNNGYGGFYMTNCFPIVSSEPDIVRDWYYSLIGHYMAVNDMKLKEISEKCNAVVFAWGNFKIVKETKRDKQLAEMFPDAMALFINKNGSPKHPLFCRADTRFVKWSNGS